MIFGLQHITKARNLFREIDYWLNEAQGNLKLQPDYAEQCFRKAGYAASMLSEIACLEDDPPKTQGAWVHNVLITNKDGQSS